MYDYYHQYEVRTTEVTFEPKAVDSLCLKQDPLALGCDTPGSCPTISEPPHRHFGQDSARSTEGLREGRLCLKILQTFAFRISHSRSFTEGYFGVSKFAAWLGHLTLLLALLAGLCCTPQTRTPQNGPSPKAHKRLNLQNPSLRIPTTHLLASTELP